MNMRCPRCTKLYSVGDVLPGQVLPCSRCGTPLQVEPEASPVEMDYQDDAGSTYALQQEPEPFRSEKLPVAAGYQDDSVSAHALQQEPDKQPLSLDITPRNLAPNRFRKKLRRKRKSSISKAFAFGNLLDDKLALAIPIVLGLWFFLAAAMVVVRPVAILLLIAGILVLLAVEVYANYTWEWDDSPFLARGLYSARWLLMVIALAWNLPETWREFLLVFMGLGMIATGICGLVVWDQGGVFLF
jgi:hypothetical protein